MTYKEAYLRYMDANGIKYTDRGENMVRVAYSCSNIKSVPVIVIFDKEGKNLVQFVCCEVASFKDDKMAPGLVACNAMNAKYRWVKFYLDSDQDVRVEADALVSMDTVGEECAQMVSRMVNIIDDAYPEFMRALWS